MKKKKTAPERRKRRSRKLVHTTSAIRERVCYVCDYLFGGNVPLFANTVGLESTHLRLCLSYQSRFTPSMLAQLVSMTNVRAEWILCGVGPMLASDAPEGLETLSLPRTLGSAFSRLDNNLLPALPVALVVAPNSHDPGSITPVNTAAARIIARARSADKPVWVCLGKEALYSGARPVVASMLEKKYVTGISLTSAAAELEVPVSPVVDTSHIAKLGAQAGFGFGEALCCWGKAADDSLISVAQRMNAPVTIHPEFGEVSDHFKAGLRGAEAGAVLGAVAHVDLLIFAENIRKFSGSPGGVFIALGDGYRFANLFRQALRVAKQIEQEPYRDFAFVLVDHSTGLTAGHLIECDGGQFHFMKGDIASETDGLAKACDAVFDGDI